MKGFATYLLIALACASALSACGGGGSSSSSAATTTQGGAVTGVSTPKTVSVVTAN
jgi:hypothetical protein